MRRRGERASALLSVVGLWGVVACVPHPDDVDSQEIGQGRERIVGGQGVNITDLPWQVSIWSRFGGHFCGGSVISEDWVLTAAHCMEGSSPNNTIVIAGISRQSQANSGQVRLAAEINVFPGFITPERGRDIALIRLSDPLDLSVPEVQAIGLMSPELAAQGLTSPGNNAIVSGWGALSSNGGSPDQLQAVVLPLISNAEANAAYRSVRITDDQLGAGLLGTGGRDSCQGDSGGPLAVSDGSGNGLLLAGVVSWGFGCASARFPGMYARVSAFQSWITSITGIQPGGAAPTNPTPTPPPAGWSASGEPNLALIDNGEACTTLTVANAGDASSARIDLLGQHAWRSILRATLEHNGVVVEVFGTGSFPRGEGTFRLTDQAVQGLPGGRSGRLDALRCRHRRLWRYGCAPAVERSRLKLRAQQLIDLRNSALDGADHRLGVLVALILLVDGRVELNGWNHVHVKATQVLVDDQRVRDDVRQDGEKKIALGDHHRRGQQGGFEPDLARKLDRPAVHGTASITGHRDRKGVLQQPAQIHIRHIKQRVPSAAVHRRAANAQALDEQLLVAERVIIKGDVQSTLH